MLDLELKHRPILDPDFVPAVSWNQAYQGIVRGNRRSRPLVIAFECADGSISIYETRVLPHEGEYVALNERYVERLLKFLLWQKGGLKVMVDGDPGIVAMLKSVYSYEGARKFDYQFMSEKVYGVLLVIEPFHFDRTSIANQNGSLSLGRHLDGCRIGFDLGGSDRKCSALIDGEVVHSEEIVWDPYFQKNPQYHLDGINDSLKRAAKYLPRVDAIGGSAAGVYINNEIRVASLFRGVSQEDFESHVRPMFINLKERWKHLPFEVANDGEVTALAGSMSFNDNAVLGISMGTSLAAGYVDGQGHIRPWLNELAFAPIDYRERGAVDEWSGDLGCGVQYFSQQGVNRLIPSAGIELPPEMPLAEKLAEVQKLIAAGDKRARAIYETIGICFGYAIAHYADFYDFRNLLILGRVSSGEGGSIIIDKANKVLKDAFPDITEKVSIKTLSEKDKRHGQAIAAASLPALNKDNEAVQTNGV